MGKTDNARIAPTPPVKIAHGSDLFVGYKKNRKAEDNFRANEARCPAEQPVRCPLCPCFVRFKLSVDASTVMSLATPEPRLAVRRTAAACANPRA